jgi:[acyl-carrier-protein] S-malonyltransferase
VLDTVAAAAGSPDFWTQAQSPDAGRRTAVAQPAIFGLSLAAYRALRDAGVTADVVAGHSLGEVSAATAAGCLSVADAAALVVERGRAMAKACTRQPGAMLAVRRDAEGLADVLAEHPEVVVANENSPEQTVLAGRDGAVRAVAEALRASGVRSLPLQVEGAFHSPLMSPASFALAQAIEHTPLEDAEVPLVSGVDAKLVTHGDEIATRLVRGLTAPVRWTSVLHRLVAEGVDEAIEVGPGGVLAGLARRTVPTLVVHTVATPDDLTALLAARDTRPLDHARTVTR